MSEEILVAKDIKKSFGHFRVLNGVNLSINRGDRYILFGSNGAGKTTLVKILSTLLSADSGEIIIFGKKPGKNLKDIKTKIGFMSHDPYLYNELTAFENLNFYSNLYSLQNNNERVKNLLKEIGLYHRANDRVGSFSRGMKQRLSLARAILHDPDIIFLDEPYTGLDIMAQSILNDLIVRLNNKGKTFFFITHDVSKGFDIAKKSGILSKGKILFEMEGGEREAFSNKYKELIQEETG